ncbi:hypothetical protein BU26DRAFT_108763 [Trematosphaeria pertusa]|uniref:Uncharacterized protein n=1 Tax=Trematosphaeria pertusa TaxID=390896 RepID=A0A6A6I0G0_9PLEO|nr:uncharacterized protein BU26DRAFT_108763 [Trematosphaeria pertusa]KAF2243767.1 hypothetical protein BU26DRAFT_108763 [Trematosphaeria pertusa]
MGLVWTRCTVREGHLALIYEVFHLPAVYRLSKGLGGYGVRRGVLRTGWLAGREEGLILTAVVVLRSLNIVRYLLLSMSSWCLVVCAISSVYLSMPA